MQSTFFARPIYMTLSVIARVVKTLRQAICYLSLSIDRFSRERTNIVGGKLDLADRPQGAQTTGLTGRPSCLGLYYAYGFVFTARGIPLRVTVSSAGLQAAAGGKRPALPPTAHSTPIRQMSAASDELIAVNKKAVSSAIQRRFRSGHAASIM